MSAQPGTIVFSDQNFDSPEDTSLLDILDHVLNQGIVLRGNLVISLAGVDLVYVGLDVILTSVETALRHMSLATSQPDE
jgi:hypothetical protein